MGSRGVAGYAALVRSLYMTVTETSSQTGMHLSANFGIGPDGPFVKGAPFVDL